MSDIATPEAGLQLIAHKAFSNQAPLALLAFFMGVSSIGVLLMMEKVSFGWAWLVMLYITHFLSFLIRFNHKKITKTVSSTEKLAASMNCIDSLLTSACLLFLPEVSEGVGIFTMTILLVLCVGSTFTTAGYPLFLWSFSAPMLASMIIAYTYMYITTDKAIYGVAVAVVAFSFLSISRFAHNNREALLDVLRAQRLAIRAQQSKTRFFMASTHDIRQPLTAASAFINTALHLNKNDNVEKSLNNALTSVQLIDDYIEPVMELVQLDAEEFSVNIENVDIVQTLQKLIPLFEHSNNKNIQLKFICSYHSIPINSDEKLLTRILSNLIENSLKYTNEGTIKISLVKLNEIIQVIIHDTGIGIEKNKLDMVFDEFYQIDNKHRDPSKGYGLGLPITLKLCEKLNIGINIESKKGVYTKVTLNIPE